MTTARLITNIGIDAYNLAVALRTLDHAGLPDGSVVRHDGVKQARTRPTGIKERSVGLALELARGVRPAVGSGQAGRVLSPSAETQDRGLAIIS